jgi:hypothetical protein
MILVVVFWGAILTAVLVGGYQVLLTKKCPECRSHVDKQARRCKHCSTDLG